LNREASNAEAQALELQRKTRAAALQERNRQQWILFYETLYRSYARRASECAEKAVQLLGEE
jgi:hypothetical protein